MSTPQPDLPVIDVTNRRLRELTEEALDVLVAANDTPELFVRLGDPVRVVRDEKGRARLARVGEAVLRHRLARVADFVKVATSGKAAGTVSFVTPPVDVVQDILACGGWPFPPVEAVTTVPVLRPDGSVLAEPGYDPETRLVYTPDPALTIPAVPSEPTPAQLMEARTAIFDLLRDFPFVDFASMANMVALLFTPVLRPAIDGLVPLALLDKPKRGTGASLLAQVVTIVAFGSATDLMTAPGTDEEMRKKITAALLAGLTIFYFDNVETVLTSPSLAACLTTDVWSDRILGRSEIARDLVQRATWMATGNNLHVGGDLGRRCYHIRLDAKMARPWGRSDFKHRHLKRHVRQHRGEILAALLTIARGWFATGCPTAETPTLGNFEEWTRMLGGVLAFMEVPGFLGNLEELYRTVDEDDAAWEGFLAGWHQTFGEAPTTVAEVVEVVKKTEPTSVREALPPDLLDALAGKAKASFERKLAWALRKHEGAIFGEYRLGRDGTKANAVRWRVSHASQMSHSQPSDPSPNASNTGGFSTGDDSGDSHDSLDPTPSGGREPGQDDDPTPAWTGDGTLAQSGDGGSATNTPGDRETEGDEPKGADGTKPRVRSVTL